MALPAGVGRVRVPVVRARSCRAPVAFSGAVGDEAEAPRFFARSKYALVAPGDALFIPLKSLRDEMPQRVGWAVATASIHGVVPIGEHAPSDAGLFFGACRAARARARARPRGARGLGQDEAQATLSRSPPPLSLSLSSSLLLLAKGRGYRLATRLHAAAYVLLLVLLPCASAACRGAGRARALAAAASALALARGEAVAPADAEGARAAPPRARASARAPLLGVYQIAGAGFFFGFFSQVNHLTENTVAAASRHAAAARAALDARAPGGGVGAPSWATRQVECSNNFATARRRPPRVPRLEPPQLPDRAPPLPGVNHEHLPLIAPVVRATCAEFGVEYGHFATWREILAALQGNYAALARPRGARRRRATSRRSAPRRPAAAAAARRPPAAPLARLGHRVRVDAVRRRAAHADRRGRAVSAARRGPRRAADARARAPTPPPRRGLLPARPTTTPPPRGRPSGRAKPPPRCRSFYFPRPARTRVRRDATCAAQCRVSDDTSCGARGEAGNRPRRPRRARARRAARARRREIAPVRIPRARFRTRRPRRGPCTASFATRPASWQYLRRERA